MIQALDAVVVGAGVSGLTTAIRLAEAGLQVHVIAADPPGRTTSAKAGASWGPYMTSDPHTLPWSIATLDALRSIAAEDPTSGVRMATGIEASQADMAPPDWAFSVDGFRVCAAAELPDGYASGWEYTIPLVDMPRYLGYLERRLDGLGVEIEIQTSPIETFDKVGHLAPIVVNCTGLAARRLVDDPQLAGTMGQMVVVANPGIDRFFQDVTESAELTYVIPHEDYVILGGNAEPGCEDLTVDPDVIAGIVDRCVAVEPRLRDAPVLGYRVGIRPSRPTVRLEREEADGYTLIHNYGHGGSGITLSWGCAQEVRGLV
jgi:D-amino-acid oxidase